MQRRTLLGFGLAAGAVLAWTGWSVSRLYEPAWSDGALLGPGRRVLHAVALAVLDGSLPPGGAELSTAVDAHLTRMQDTLNNLGPAAQAEVAALLALLAAPAGRIALTGLTASWIDASPQQVQTALQSMRASSLLLRRQAYAALRDLTHAAYYSDSATWPLLRYPGPRAVE
jgi:hypothetical protein